MRSDCVNLRGENKRHCRLEGLIGSAVLVQVLLSAALGPSTITVGGTGKWLGLGRGRHGCDRPHGAAAIGTDGEVRCGDRAIAFGAIVGPLADDTRVAGIEQPMTASEAFAAGAIGEDAVVTDTMEAVGQSVEQKAGGGVRS